MPDDGLLGIEIVIGLFNHPVLHWYEIAIQVGAIQGRGPMDETADVGFILDCGTIILLYLFNDGRYGIQHP